MYPDLEMVGWGWIGVENPFPGWCSRTVISIMNGACPDREIGFGDQGYFRECCELDLRKCIWNMKNIYLYVRK